MRESNLAMGSVRLPGNSVRLSRMALWTWGIACIGIVVGIVLIQSDMRFVPAGLTILCFGPLFVRLDRETVPVLLIGPASIAYLYHVLGYALGPIGQYYVAGYLELNTIEFERSFTLAQWGCVLGLISFAIVYPWVFRAVTRWLARRFPSPPAESERDWAVYGLILAGFAAFLIVYGFVTGATSRLARVDDVDVVTATVAASFATVHQLMFFFLGYAAARRRGCWIAGWLLIYLVYAAFFILDGGRGTVVTAGIVSAIGWAAGGASRKKVLGVILAAAIVFVPLSGIVAIYRGGFLGRTESFSERLSELAFATREFSSGASAEEFGSAESFMQRVTTLTVDRVFELTPSEIPFAGLEGIQNVVFALVPRVINPERPVLVDGNELSIRYGVLLPDTTKSYMPAVGDGYRRFGWTGIALLYAFSAFLFSSISAVAYRFRTRREWMAMLVLTVIFASEIMIHTLLSLFYVLLWVMPKYFVFFFLLRWSQDGFSRLTRKPTESHTG